MSKLPDWNGLEEATTMFNKRRHKLIFKNGTSVILTQDTNVHPKMSETYRLVAGQLLKVTSQGYYNDYDVLDNNLSVPTPWVRCNGINPRTGKKYHFDFAVDVPLLVEATETHRLLYGT